MEKWIGAALITLTSSGCGAALFSEDFDDMALGAPGAADTGELQTAGNVVVVGAPADVCAGADANWLRLVVPPEGGAVTALLAAPVYDGQHTATFALCLGPGSGDFSIDVLTDRAATSLIHIDLMADGTIRINDRETIGNFRNGPITVLATVTPADTAIGVVSRATTANHRQPHPRPSLATLGFAGVRLSFPPRHRGSVFIDYIRVAAAD